MSVSDKAALRQSKKEYTTEKTSSSTEVLIMLSLRIDDKDFKNSGSPALLCDVSRKVAPTMDHAGVAANPL